LAPVPVGVLIFETGAAISTAELNRNRCRFRSFRRNRAVTRTRALDSSKLMQRSVRGAVAGTPPPSPISGAAESPTFWPPPPPLASSRSCRRARPVLIPTASGPCPARAGSKIRCAPCTSIFRKYRSPSLVMRDWAGSGPTRYAWAAGPLAAAHIEQCRGLFQIARCLPPSTRTSERSIRPLNSLIFAVNDSICSNSGRKRCWSPAGRAHRFHAERVGVAGWQPLPRRLGETVRRIHQAGARIGRPSGDSSR